NRRTLRTELRAKRRAALRAALRTKHWAALRAQRRAEQRADMGTLWCCDWLIPCTVTNNHCANRDVALVLEKSQGQSHEGRTYEECAHACFGCRTERWAER